MKKPLAIVLLLSLLISLVGCGKASDEELIEAAKPLIEKAQVLDELFSVKGIPTLGGKETDTYLRADASELAKYGFSSYKEMRAYAASFYTEAMLRQFENTFVNSLSNAHGIIRVTYCYDETDQKGNFIALWVSADGVNYKTDSVTYDFSTLKVEKKLRDAATLSLDATVTNEDGATRVHQKTIRLVREFGEWRLDSNTAISFGTAKP